MTTPQTSPSFNEEARRILAAHARTYFKVRAGPTDQLSLDEASAALQALHDRLVEAAHVAGLKVAQREVEYARRLQETYLTAQASAPLPKIMACKHCTEAFKRGEAIGMSPEALPNNPGLKVQQDSMPAQLTTKEDKTNEHR